MKVLILITALLLSLSLLASSSSVGHHDAAAALLLSNAKSGHLGFMRALDAAASSESHSDMLTSLAATRASSLKSLMLSNPNEALNLIESLSSKYSSHPHMASLQAAGHIETSFSSKSDLTYSCGLRLMHSPNNHTASNGNNVRFIMEEWVFRHDISRSFKVRVPDNFPLRPRWTHTNVDLSGFVLDDTAVLRHPVNLDSVTDYTAVGGFAVKPKGVHSILFIMADFPDKPGRPANDGQMNSMEQGTIEYFNDASYGQATLSTPVRTPTLRLPRPSYNYGGDFNWLAKDMISLSKGAGFNPDNFDFVVYLFPHNPLFNFGGLGYVGAKGVWNNGNVDGTFAVKVVCHELGHNFGLNHASRWRLNQPQNPVSLDGGNDEYGDNFDMMGGGQGIGAHYNAFYKLNLGWLDLATEASTCATNCATSVPATFKLWPSDQSGSRGNINAVDLHRSVNTPNGNYYWISTKSGGRAPLPRDFVGVFIHVSQPVYGIPKTYLINTHPEYNNNQGVGHAALQVGETFSDCGQNIHITNTQFSLCKSSGNIAADVQACMGPLAWGTLCCATAVVNRVSGQTNILQIAALVPKDIKVNSPFTITGYTEAGAKVYVNCKGDTFSNYPDSTTCQLSQSGYVKMVLRATDMKGRQTKWTFYVAVGNPSGSAPAIGPSDSWYQTCAAGRVAGYTGVFGAVIPTVTPTTPPPPPTGNSLLNLNVPASSAFSLRLLTPTYRGPAIKVRRSSDSATMDIGFNSAGGLDTVGLSKFVGINNTAYLTTWYDQSGNGNSAVQAIPAQQPSIALPGSIVTSILGSWQSYGPNTYCTLNPAWAFNLMSASDCQATCFNHGFKFTLTTPQSCECGNSFSDCMSVDGFNAYELKTTSQTNKLPMVVFNGSSSTHLSLLKYPFQNGLSAAAYLVNKVTSLQQWQRYFDFGTGENAYIYASPSSPNCFKITTNTYNNEQGVIGQLMNKINNNLFLAEFHHTGAGANGIMTASTTLGGSLSTLNNQYISVAPFALNGASNNYIGRSQFNDPYFDGWMSELIFYAVDPQVASNSAQAPAFVQNIRTYYGL